MEYTDPLEQRDRWRAFWHILTHDGVIALLGALVVAAAIALSVLPQSPTNSTTRAIEQWTAEQRLQIGDLFETLNLLGLNAIAQSIWVRIALAGFIAIALARLLDRIVRILRDRSQTLAIDDEVRVRVTDRAPTLLHMQGMLQNMRYRAAIHGEELHATRAPLAAAISAAWHAAAIIGAIGLLANITGGWDVANELLTPGTPVELRNNFTLTLSPEPASATQADLRLSPAGGDARLAVNDLVTLGATRLHLRQLSPGYRVSATGPDNRALPIRTSNYVSPTTDAKLSFGAERAINLVVPEAQLAVNIEQGDKPGDDRVRMISIGSAQIIADAPIAPTMAITGATFSFAPNTNAVVSVQHRPGNLPMWGGFSLALLGLILALLLPMRRMIVRQHSHWTEIYASGRNVRRDARKLLAEPER